MNEAVLLQLRSVSDALRHCISPGIGQASTFLPF